ncbi:MAG: hypothetical protein ABSH16_09250 [Sedimentisphaerales bacterium]
MNYIPADTTLEAHRKQVEILRKLSPQSKALMAMELTDNIRQIAIEGIRSRHPEFNEKQVMRELLRMLVGDELFKKIAAAKGFE